MEPQEKDQAVKKPNILKRLLALLVTLVLVLGAVALVAYRDELNIDALRRYLSYRALEKNESGQVEPFVHAGGDRISLARLGDGVVLSSTSGGYYYTLGGKEIASAVAAMAQPVLSAGERAAAVYDAGGQSLVLFRDGSQETFTLTLSGTESLLSARVNDAGYLVVTAQQSGYKGVVTLYDPSGNQVIGINYSSVFVMDAAVSPDGKRVAVIAMDVSQGSYVSRLMVYASDQKEPLAQVDLGSQAVLDVDYEQGELWVLGEESLKIVQEDGTLLGEYSYGGSYLKGCALGGDGFAALLLGEYRSGGQDRLATVDGKGEELGSRQLEQQVLCLSAAGRYVSTLTGRDLEIYTRDLSPYDSLQEVSGARYAAVSDDGSAALAGSQTAWLYLP